MTDETQSTDVAVVERKPLASITPGSPVQAFVPTNFDEAVRIARAIAVSEMAPKSYKNDANRILVGMMTGAEVGLTPMQSLRGVAVIGNQPSLWGDVALGVVLASGLLEDMAETQEGSFVPGGDGVAICTMRRKGRPTPVTRKYDMKRAQKAKLLTKEGAWQVDPERMAQMRARAFTMRDLFPDVLSGLNFAEILEDEEHAARANASRETVSATVEDLHEQAGTEATNKLLTGMREAVAHAKGEGDAKETVVHVHGKINETDQPKPLATDGATRQATESERLLAAEAARAATAPKDRPQRVRKSRAKAQEPVDDGNNPPAPPADVEQNTQGESGTAREAPGESSSGDSESGTASSPPATQRVAAPPNKLKERDDLLWMRDEYQRDVDNAPDEEKRAFFQKQLDNALAGLAKLEAEYIFPEFAEVHPLVGSDDNEEEAEFEPAEPADDGISTRDGYDLNRDDPAPDPHRLKDAIAHLNTLDNIPAVGVYQPPNFESWSDEDKAEFASAVGLRIAKIHAEARRR